MCWGWSTVVNSINKKQNIMHNSISDQTLTYTNQLTIKAWNDIINILKTQANLNADYIETLHKWFIGEDNNVLQTPEGYSSFSEYLISTLENSNEFLVGISSSTYDVTTGIATINFIANDGTLKPLKIDLPTENLVQDASYDKTTGVLTFTWQGGASTSVELSMPSVVAITEAEIEAIFIYD